MTQPVLLTAFNRPDLTARVMEAIRDYGPEQLFVAVDGPRVDRTEDQELCEAVRRVVGQVGWDCDVRYLLRETNLGCRPAMTEALDWFFGNVEEGIVLEDDCFASPDFFRFAELLLERYRADERVWMISGTNVLGRWRPTGASYHFGSYGAIWGWATWRRAWRKADIALTHLASPAVVARVRSNWGEQRWAALKPQLDAVVEGRLSAWDYGWHFSYASEGGLAAFPAENLVANIGHGPGATHTLRARHPLARLPIGRLDSPLRHPERIAPDTEFDHRYLAVDRPTRLIRARARIARVLPQPVRVTLRRLLGFDHESR
jgi:hypothetical protein